MKLSVKLRPCLWDLLVAAVIVTAAVSLGIFLRQQTAGASEKLEAVISQNGTVLQTIPLSEIPEGETREVSVGGTYTEVIALEHERVCVESSNCPTEDCVHTGWISRAGQSVVCLPNRLVVELRSADSAGPGDVDLVLG